MAFLQLFQVLGLLLSEHHEGILLHLPLLLFQIHLLFLESYRSFLLILFM